MRVLIVDDYPHIRRSLSRMLGDLGYDTVTAADGGVAVTMLKDTDVDIVLTDLDMPVIKGDALIAWVRTNNPSIKTILMSGHSHVKQLAIDCGADEYFVKGSDLSLLDKAIKTIARTP